MLQNYLAILPAINATITVSDVKAFKDNKLILTNSEVIYIRNCLKIFNVFVKATTKLQAEKYPTIYYLMPEVYVVYKSLERIKGELNVSDLF